MRASAELMRAANSAMRSPSLRSSSLSSLGPEPERAGMASMDTAWAPVGSRTIAGHEANLRRVS